MRNSQDYPSERYGSSVSVKYPKPLYWFQSRPKNVFRSLAVFHCMMQFDTISQQRNSQSPQTSQGAVSRQTLDHF